MKIEIIQIRNNNGQWVCLEPNDNPIIVDRGYIIADEFDEDRCWDLCNWGCLPKKVKPKNLISELEFCNSDVAFKNPQTGNWSVPKHIGWKTCNTKEDAIKCLKQNI